MYTKQRFRKGDLVEGSTFDGQKIIGNFVRALPSFGVIVEKISELSPTEVEQYKCTRLSLRRVAPKQRYQLDGARLSFATGDLCTGETLDGEYIIGKYANAGPKPYAFIRGVIAKNGLASPFEPLRTFKVLRSSLKKQA